MNVDSLTWTARRYLWHASSLRSVRNCGRAPRSPYVDVRSSGRGTVATVGTQRCGSVWSCPVCSSLLMRARAEILQQVVGRWDQVSFGTLTIPHTSGPDVKTRRMALQRTWRRAVKHLRRDFGPFDYVRVLEVTKGRDGKGHPHFHVLLDRQDVAHELVQRWLLAFPGASRSAQHVRPGDAGAAVAYLTAEAFGSWGKSNSHWSILKAALDDATHLEHWRTFEQGMKGARQMMLSRGLIDRTGLDTMTIDQVEEPLETWLLDTVGRCAWNRLRVNPHVYADALAAWADWDLQSVDDILATVKSRRYADGIHGLGCSCDVL